MSFADLFESAGVRETVLAAVSGGPDSMAMFHALCRHALRHDSMCVVAAHFNHRLRPDSNRDLDVVMSVAAEYGVRVLSGEGDVAAHARASRQSIEAAARELRYRFLEDIATEINADEILTAHTRDDHIETVVMRLIRGAGARGLRGISPRYGCIARPLLAVTHDETLEYCKRHRVPFVLDPSNDDVHFFRNHIRHEVLPVLREKYPGIDAMLVQLSSRARIVFDEASLEIADRARDLRREGDQWILPRSSFDGIHSSMPCITLLMRSLDLIGMRKDVTRAHYMALLNLIHATPGKSVDLPRIRVRLEHDALVFAPRGPGEERDCDQRALPLETTVRFGDWSVSTRLASAAETRREIETGPSPWVAYAPMDSVLAIRFPRDGDRMQPFGMSGHKKLSDLFIDMKIPRRLRVETPVIEWNDEILWVVGVAASELTRIDGKTGDVVRLTAARSAP